MKDRRRITPPWQWAVLFKINHADINFVYITNSFRLQSAKQFETTPQTRHCAEILLCLKRKWLSKNKNLSLTLSQFPWQPIGLKSEILKVFHIPSVRCLWVYNCLHLCVDMLRSAQGSFTYRAASRISDLHILKFSFIEHRNVSTSFSYSMMFTTVNRRLNVSFDNLVWTSRCSVPVK